MSGCGENYIMVEKIRTILSDNKGARWTALFIVAFTMMMGYFITDVMSPLEVLLTKSAADGGLGWTSDDYGFFSGSYGYINVFLLMLFFGGIILDKMGIRFTGVLACGLMVIGVCIKFFGITHDFEGARFTIDALNFSLPMSAAIASLGFAIFGTGCEICGITVSKIITKWFTGHELALAMGIQVALARMGTAGAMMGSLPIAKAFGDNVGAPVLLGTVLLIIGFLAFLVYTVMDKKLDKSTEEAKIADKTPAGEAEEAEIEKTETAEEDEDFHFSDLKYIFSNPGFWCICLLCLLFYSGVFPFLKFATKLMIANYNVPESLAGIIPGLIPFGTILLTPLFGSLYDRIGKGATLMLIGSIMLTAVHFIFAIHILPYWWFAVIVMITLGVAFSLVPSAMWPSVPKIIPMKTLGSAYSIIFYIQNIGLSLVPVLIGKVNGMDPTYTTSMSIFCGFGVAAVILSLLLIVVDKKKHYGLQEANIKK